jgi:hypothetical protein
LSYLGSLRIINWLKETADHFFVVELFLFCCFEIKWLIGADAVRWRWIVWEEFCSIFSITIWGFGHFSRGFVESTQFVVVVVGGGGWGTISINFLS